MIDAFFVNGPWHEQVRSYADPPDYIELEGGEYVRTRLGTPDGGHVYAWLSLDPIEQFARQVERVAYDNGFGGGEVDVA